MTDFDTCDSEPFVADVTPQDGSLEAAASAAEIFIQQVEGYLQRLRTAMCTDLETLQAEIAAIDIETSFLDLTDTPASYAGAGGDTVKVKATEDGLEFVSGVSSTRNIWGRQLSVGSAGITLTTGAANIDISLPDPMEDAFDSGSPFLSYAAPEATILADGVYELSLFMCIEGSATAVMQIEVDTGGGYSIVTFTGMGGSTRQGGANSIILELAAGDTVKVTGRTTIGTAAVLRSHTSWMIERIS